MKLKRFEALSLQEALQAVKAELGPEAVIVSSRRIQKGGGLFGLLSQTVVEVTAAVDQVPQSSDAPSSPDQSLRALIAKSCSSEVPSRTRPKANKDATFSEQLQVATVLDPVTQHLHDMREEIQRLREAQKDPELALGPLRQELEGLRIVVGELQPVLLCSQSIRAQLYRLVSPGVHALAVLSPNELDPKTKIQAIEVVRMPHEAETV